MKLWNLTDDEKMELSCKIAKVGLGFIWPTIAASVLLVVSPQVFGLHSVVFKIVVLITAALWIVTLLILGLGLAIAVWVDDGPSA